MNKITQLATPDNSPLFAVEVGKGAFQLTNSIQVQPFVSMKQKTKNRQRNKLARKARGKK